MVLNYRNEDTIPLPHNFVRGLKFAISLRAILRNRELQLSILLETRAESRVGPTDDRKMLT